MNVRVSLIIPCYNEARYIDGLLENLLRQDYPHHLLEIIVADGRSTDGTLLRLAHWKKQLPNLRIIDNPHRFVPHALNAAIAASEGDVIIRLDAHAIYPENYISVLTERLFALDADNVGGMWITEAGAATAEAHAIALASTHPLGIGNAGYRLGADRETETDTVPYGCFRRSLFGRIGTFDTDLLRNQDDEFNGRIRKHGGHIWLIPSLKIRYFARPDRRSLARMFYQYGLFKPLVNIKLGAPATLRQFAPPVLALSLALTLALSFFSSVSAWLFVVGALLYLLPVAVVSWQLSKDSAAFQRSPLFYHLVFTFPAIHFSYGFGYLAGMVRFMLLRQHRRNTLTLPDNR